MRIEDFGFKPLQGKKYVVNFTSDGELISTSTYNGQPLPQIEFPDNSVINLTVTDKDTGKTMMTSEFISYNGKLYKSIFNLPLTDKQSNKDKDVKLHDLHYDLTTGSVLVKVQGFAGEKYKLKISDTTVKSKAASMEITLKEGTYYSIPTTLVQGNEFEITLTDKFNKDLSSQKFTAPIDTSWRSTQESQNTEIPTEKEEEPIKQETHDASINDDKNTAVDGQTETPSVKPQTQTQDTNSSLISMDGKIMGFDKPVVYGAGAGLALIILILLILRAKVSKRIKANREAEEDAINHNRHSASGNDSEEREHFENQMEVNRLEVDNDNKENDSLFDTDNDLDGEFDDLMNPQFDEPEEEESIEPKSKKKRK